MTLVLFLTCILFGLAMFAMAIGVLLGRPCLRGSCGGVEIVGADGDSLSCPACPNRDLHHDADGNKIPGACDH